MNINFGKAVNSGLKFGVNQVATPFLVSIGSGIALNSILWTYRTAKRVYKAKKNRKSYVEVPQEEVQPDDVTYSLE